MLNMRGLRGLRAGKPVTITERALAFDMILAGIGKHGLGGRDYRGPTPHAVP